MEELLHSGDEILVVPSEQPLRLGGLDEGSERIAVAAEDFDGLLQSGSTIGDCVGRCAAAKFAQGVLVGRFNGFPPAPARRKSEYRDDDLVVEFLRLYLDHLAFDEVVGDGMFTQDDLDAVGE